MRNRGGEAHSCLERNATLLRDENDLAELTDQTHELIEKVAHQWFAVRKERVQAEVIARVPLIRRGESLPTLGTLPQFALLHGSSRMLSS